MLITSKVGVLRIAVCLAGVLMTLVLAARPGAAQALPQGTITVIGPAPCAPLQTVGDPGYRAFDPTMTSCFEAQVNCP